MTDDVKNKLGFEYIFITFLGNTFDSFEPD